MNSTSLGLVRKMGVSWILNFLGEQSVHASTQKKSNVLSTTSYPTSYPNHTSDSFKAEFWKRLQQYMMRSALWGLHKMRRWVFLWYLFLCLLFSYLFFFFLHTSCMQSFSVNSLEMHNEMPKYNEVTELFPDFVYYWISECTFSIVLGITKFNITI